MGFIGICIYRGDIFNTWEFSTIKLMKGQNCFFYLFRCLFRCLFNIPSDTFLDGFLDVLVHVFVILEVSKVPSVESALYKVPSHHLLPPLFSLNHTPPKQPRPLAGFCSFLCEVGGHTREECRRWAACQRDTANGIRMAMEGTYKHQVRTLYNTFLFGVALLMDP